MRGSTRKIAFFVLAIVACATVAFIVAHGMQASAGSWEESNAVAALLEPVLRRFFNLANKIAAWSGHSMALSYGEFVRKIAHFVEYSLLGAECAGLTVILTRRIISPYLWADLFAVLMLAVLDEFLQSFAGRTSQVTDVMLDFFGALCGIAVVLIVLAIVDRARDQCPERSVRQSLRGNGA